MFQIIQESVFWFWYIIQNILIYIHFIQWETKMLGSRFYILNRFGLQFNFFFTMEFLNVFCRLVINLSKDYNLLLKSFKLVMAYKICLFRMEIIGEAFSTSTLLHLSKLVFWQENILVIWQENILVIWQENILVIWQGKLSVM